MLEGLVKGPWVALDGFVQVEDKKLGRQVFGFFRGAIYEKKIENEIVGVLETEEYLGNDFIPREPDAVYTYSGEFPWCSKSQFPNEFDAQKTIYESEIGSRFNFGDGHMIEIPSHNYGWEDYHSIVNRTGGHSVPSVKIASFLGISPRPNSLNFQDRNGKLASVTFSTPPTASTVSLLYLRKDLFDKYLRGFKKEFLWAIWGERNLIYSSGNAAYENSGRYDWHTRVWRHIKKYKLRRAARRNK